jgi:hypothetical protein
MKYFTPDYGQEKIMSLSKYTDREIVAELFKRIGEPLPEKGKEWKLKEHSENPKIKGFSYFYTAFDFDNDKLTTIGAYE